MEKTVNATDFVLNTEDFILSPHETEFLTLMRRAKTWTVEAKNRSVEKIKEAPVADKEMICIYEKILFSAGPGSGPETQTA